MEDKCIIETINKDFEVLKFNNISSYDEIDFNFLQLLDNEGEDDEHKMEIVQVWELNLIAFILDKYYYFKCKLENI